jgi:hypothetical protein
VRHASRAVPSGNVTAVPSGSGRFSPTSRTSANGRNRAAPTHFGKKGCSRRTPGKAVFKDGRLNFETTKADSCL